MYIIKYRYIINCLIIIFVLSFYSCDNGISYDSNYKYFSYDINFDSLEYKSKEILYYNKEPFTGKVYHYSLKDRITFSFNFKDGIKVGVQEATYDNGNEYFRVIVKNGEVNDTIKKFYDNGKIFFIGYYKCSLLQGKTSRFYKSGSIYNEITYKGGKANGVAYQYYENGNISSECNYLGGKLNGNYKFYNERRSIIVNSNYADGLIDGKYEKFYENGISQIQCVYNKGKLEGDYKLFNSEGNLIRSTKYKSNAVVDYDVTFNDNGKIIDFKWYKDTVIVKEVIECGFKEALNLYSSLFLKYSNDENPFTIILNDIFDEVAWRGWYLDDNYLVYICKSFKNGKLDEIISGHNSGIPIEESEVKVERDEDYYNRPIPEFESNEYYFYRINNLTSKNYTSIIENKNITDSATFRTNNISNAYDWFDIKVKFSNGYLIFPVKVVIKRYSMLDEVYVDLLNFTYESNINSNGTGVVNKIGIDYESGNKPFIWTSFNFKNYKLNNKEEFAEKYFAEKERKKEEQKKEIIERITKQKQKQEQEKENALKNLPGTYYSSNGYSIYLGTNGSGYIKSKEPLFDVGYVQFYYEVKDEYINAACIRSQFPNDEVSFKIILNNGIVYLSPWTSMAAGNLFFKKR